MNNYNDESLSALIDGETDELELRRILNASEKSPEIYSKWERYNTIRSALHDQPIYTVDLSKGIRQALDGEPMDDLPASLDSSESRVNFDGAAAYRKSAGSDQFDEAASVILASDAAAESEAKNIGLSDQHWKYSVRSISQVAVMVLVIGSLSWFSNSQFSTIGEPDAVALQPAALQPVSFQASVDGNVTMSYSDQFAGDSSAEYWITASDSVGGGDKALAVESRDLTSQLNLDGYVFQHVESAAMNTGHGILPYARLASWQIK